MKIMGKRLLHFVAAALLAASSFGNAQISDLSGSGQQAGCSGAAGCQTPDQTQGMPDSGLGPSGSPYGVDQTGQTGAAGGYGANLPGSATGGLTRSPSGVYVDSAGAQRQPSAYGSRISDRMPDPITDFQRLVQASTGQMLPIYGRQLFRGVPSTFAPVDLAPVTPDYLIGPGDELLIRVWGQISFNNRLTVDRAGNIYIPQVGSVHVAGLPYAQLDRQLRAAIGRVYRNFDLNVNLGQLRSIQVFVVGQARRPGSYTVSSLSTLVNAIFASGGPSVEGSMRHIQLRRSGKILSEFDLYDLLNRGDKSQDAQLLSGDVIFIPPVGAQVALSGSVRVPAIYELKGGETLGQLIEAAGGLSSIASGGRASVERIEGRVARQATEAALDAAGLATPLRDGDVVRIFPISARYDKSVTLRGNLANPGRFAWHPGMRLSELLPERAALLTNGYWRNRNRLGLPAPFFEPLPPSPQPRGYGVAPQSRRSTSSGLGTSIAGGTQLTNDGSLFPDQTLEDGSIPIDGQQPYQGQQQPYSDQAYPGQPYSDQLYPGQPYPNQSGQSGYDPSNPYGPNANPLAADGRQPVSASEQASQSSLAGTRGESSYGTASLMSVPPRNRVKLPAPEIDWSYAVIERLDPETLRNSLVPFNLGALVIDHDRSQDLELQAGDVVTIFSQADIRVPLAQQTKFVRLEGEFASSGVYSVKPGETLHQLVARAGGFTPNAYLFGSEFTRESTRVVQQRRLEEYTNSVAIELQRSGTNRIASAINPQDAATTASVLASQRDLVSRLRQMRATGRIVIEFKPGSTGIDSIPDLPLEDGDTFTVPPVPSNVNVVGAVYDQNSFLFNSSRRVYDYLRLAGGASRDADTRHAFVIRADGSVMSRSNSQSLWGNSFEKARVNPGDTIVVPEKLFKPSALRSIIDWSQVFSQFALGAAAVNVIR